MAAPRIAHLQETFHVLQYIKRTPGQGLFFLSNSSIRLKAFADFDWVTFLDTGGPSLIFVCFWVHFSYHVNPRNKKLCFVLQLRKIAEQEKVKSLHFFNL